MKNLNFYLVAILFLFSSLSAHAADLATAKVLKVTGDVLKYNAEGGNEALKEGDILREGDGITTSFLSSVDLIFSNGSELTVLENSSLSFEELAQKPFNGGNSYEQLSADPSQSQTLLQLNYGQLGGHVKKLRSDSSFEIQTPLGTAAIRGTIFRIRLKFDVVTGGMTLSVNNVNGIVELKSPFLDEVDYGKRTEHDCIVDENFTSEELDTLEVKTESIPPTHTVSIRIQVSSPLFDVIINKQVNISPLESVIQPPAAPKPPAPPQVTPEDPGVQIPSISLPKNNLTEKVSSGTIYNSISTLPPSTVNESNF